MGNTAQGTRQVGPRAPSPGLPPSALPSTEALCPAGKQKRSEICCHIQAPSVSLEAETVWVNEVQRQPPGGSGREQRPQGRPALATRQGTGPAQLTQGQKPMSTPGRTSPVAVSVSAVPWLSATCKWNV